MYQGQHFPHERNATHLGHDSHGSPSVEIPYRCRRPSALALAQSLHWGVTGRPANRPGSPASASRGTLCLHTNVHRHCFPTSQGTWPTRLGKEWMIKPPRTHLIPTWPYRTTSRRTREDGDPGRYGSPVGVALGDLTPLAFGGWNPRRGNQGMERAKQGRRIGTTQQAVPTNIPIRSPSIASPNKDPAIQESLP
jgi:hypothetical protein